MQSASGATKQLAARKNQDERFTLAIRDVSPVTVFTDRPFRHARFISPSTLTRNWKAMFGGDSPNAVLTFQDGQNPQGAPKSIVVTLSAPRYDRASRTLKFTAIRIYRFHDPVKHGNAWRRISTPTTFDGASLFIDEDLTPMVQGAMPCAGEGPDPDCVGV